MKFIEDNTDLKDLKRHIEEYVAKLELAKKNLQASTAKRNSRRQSEPSPQAKEFAATFIQKFWRKRKVKQAFVKNPYFTYLSFIDPNDEQKLLSNIMFGRHIAEFRPTSKNRIHNQGLAVTHVNFSTL